MKFQISRVLFSEDGAVTVDWVVLTAAVVGMGLLVVLSIKTALITGTNNIAAGITVETPTQPES